MATRGERQEWQTHVHQLRCVECGCRSGLYAIGWRGYRIDDPELGEVQELAFYCPTCSDTEVGEPPRHRP